MPAANITFAEGFKIKLFPLAPITVAAIATCDGQSSPAESKCLCAYNTFPFCPESTLDSKPCFAHTFILTVQEPPVADISATSILLVAGTKTFNKKTRLPF